jgi:hypothetical protein
VAALRVVMESALLPAVASRARLWAVGLAFAGSQIMRGDVDPMDVALFSARYGSLAQWNLGALLPQLAGRPVTTAALLAKFLALLEACQAEARQAGSEPFWVYSRRDVMLRRYGASARGVRDRRTTASWKPFPDDIVRFSAPEPMSAAATHT